MNQRMYGLGSKRSVIREIFEYGKARAAQVGAENVYDFSLGNPSVPPPQAVEDAIAQLLQSGDMTALHGYTSAPGDLEVREAIAAHIRKTFSFPADAAHLYMTCGAAASLTVSLSAVCNAGEEVLTFAPYFTEYKVFAETAGARLTALPSDPASFLPDLAALEAALSPKTAAVLLNSPNNPSGVVYGEETVKRLAALLAEKEKEFGRPIYLISDEPYRELVYGGVQVPYLPAYYNDTLVCYSYSKSLSLPGERIGYIFVSPRARDAEALYLAVCGAGRALGYVCAPSLFQKVVARCQGMTGDVSVYEQNRNTLLAALTSYGFTCVPPDGAFYLFVRSPEADANAFCERAKQYDLLLVPGDDFGCAGYVRIAYCVSPERIARSLPAFEKLAKSYGL